MKQARNLLFKLLVYLVLSALALSIIVPVGWVFVASLKDNSEFYGNPWTLPQSVRWQNFSDAWVTARMGDFFLTSVLVTALGLGVLLAVALPASYGLSRFVFPGRKLIRTGFMAGLFVNVNYIVVPIFLMFMDWDRSLRSAFGGGFFLNNPVVLSIVYAATALPFTIYLLSSYLVTIPAAYEEAAYADGAGYGKAMVRIILPMARPSIITVILFNFLAFWNEYILSMTLLTSPKGARTLTVGLMNLMKAQNAAAQYGRMYAGLVLIMLPTLILYICVQRKLTQGMTVGGLKG